MTGEDRFHTEYGLHSGIPACCVRFFVGEWSPMYLTKWRDTAYAEALKDSPFDYVPCPECFYNGRRVAIRDCARECGTDCVSQYRARLWRCDDDGRTGPTGNPDGDIVPSRSGADEAGMSESAFL